MSTVLEAAPRLRLPELDAFVEAHVRAQMKRQREIDRKVRHLVKYLNMSYFLSRPHTHPIPSALAAHHIGPQIARGSSFIERRLRKHLGGSESDYKKYLRNLWHFPDGDDGYEEGRYTKAYFLCRPVEILLTDCWRDKTASIAWESGAQHFPADGILRTSFFQFSVPSVIPFDTQRVDTLIADFEAEIAAKASRASNQSVEGLRSLYKVRQWIRVAGGVPNLYHDFKPESEPHTGPGRLMGLGECSLQRMERGARAKLYKDTGWWNYDFNACHPSLFFSLGKHYGRPVCVIRDYLTHLSERQQELSGRWMISKDKVKIVILAAFFGVRRSSHRKYSTLVDIAGQLGAERILADPYYHMIQLEIRSARKTLINAHRVRTGRRFTHVRNAAGKIHPLRKSDGKNYPRKRLLSFIMLGYEAWALNICCANRSDILVPMHDGWISKEPFDIAFLEHSLSKSSIQAFAFDIGLRLKGEQL
ncbi:MAG: hypothetical protein V4550_15830 [Gemmatimonadota bacterium]